MFFALVGALTRWYYLSFYNEKIPHFPIGTFAANIFGTMVLAALSLVQSGPSLSTISCSVAQALADGLTTISTFVVELCTLARKFSYLYGIISVFIAQCAMFIILGSYIWSQVVTVLSIEKVNNDRTE